MTSDIRGILLVPAEGDPYGLLQEGPCGARPPMAGKHDGHWYEYESDGALGLVVEEPDGHWVGTYAVAGSRSRGSSGGEPDARALVLAWNGKPVAEGLDRTYRCAGHHGAGSDGHNPFMDLLAQRGEWLASSMGCTVIRIDAEGREVKSEE